MIFSPPSKRWNRLRTALDLARSNRPRRLPNISLPNPASRAGTSPLSTVCNHLERGWFDCHLDRRMTHVLPVGINLDGALGLQPKPICLEILHLWNLQVSSV